MQLIQTKTYSTQDIVHARYVLDSQNQSNSPEENFRTMVDYLFSKGVKYFRVTYNLGYDQCDWDPNHLYLIGILIICTMKSLQKQQKRSGSRCFQA